jgi:hypothetical protein
MATVPVILIEADLTEVRRVYHLEKDGGWQVIENGRAP